MRELLRRFNNFRRRWRYKMGDGRALVLSGRWLVLGLLLAAVAAVGLWGGGGEPGGLNSVLQEAWQPQNPLPTDDEEGEKKAALAAAENIDNGDNKPEEEPKNAETGGADAVTPEEDEPEVYDNAPEPWANDAVLQAEADLLALGAPLADMGSSLRAYGYGFDESFGDYRLHRGIDWQAEEGSAVLAVTDGKIAGLTDDNVYGRGVVLARGDKLQFIYYGLQPAAGLAEGDSVTAGDKLGEVCEPPLFEDGYPPHLHLEIWLDGKVVDPAEYGLK